MEKTHSDKRQHKKTLLEMMVYKQISNLSSIQSEEQCQS